MSRATPPPAPPGRRSVPIDRRLWRIGAFVAFLGSAAALSLSTTAAFASGASVTITPAAGSAAGPYSDGEAVTVSVGPNTILKPGTSVNILECADPGGSSANLPRNNFPCDGLTIEGDTVLVHADGGISEPGYSLYRLPSPTLGEPTNAQPVCDQSHYCALYIGENQDDFSAPKVFSVPFLMVGSAGAGSGSARAAGSPGAGADPGSSATGASGAATTGPAGAGAARAGVALGPGSDSPGASLAYTGAPSTVWWAGIGLLLFLVGAAGRLTLRQQLRKAAP